MVDFAVACIAKLAKVLVACIGLAWHVDHNSKKVITINDWVGNFEVITITITDHYKYFTITIGRLEIAASRLTITIAAKP